MTTCRPRAVCRNAARSRSITRSADRGLPSQATNAARSAPPRATSEATSHKVSGTNATAVRRSARHAPEPRLALPSPRARAAVEGVSSRDSAISALKESPHEPSCRSQNDARGHGHPPGDIDATELEAHDSVPEKMPDTAAEVQEEDECCYHEQRATNG